MAIERGNQFVLANAMDVMVAPYAAKRRAKVVVRLLPPRMNQNQFKEFINQGESFKIAYCEFIPGKKGNNTVAPGRHSLGLVYFDEYQEAEVFMRQIHGRSITDDSDNTYEIITVMAPFQQMRPPDAATSFSDTIYQNETFEKFCREIQEAETIGVLPFSMQRPDAIADGEDDKTIIEEKGKTCLTNPLCAVVTVAINRKEANRKNAKTEGKGETEQRMNRNVSRRSEPIKIDSSIKEDRRKKNPPDFGAGALKSLTNALKNIDK